MNKFLSLMSSLLLSSAAYAAGQSDPAAPAAAPAPLLYVDGVITGASISPLVTSLKSYSDGTTARPARIELLINSPGGSVIAGTIFINQMTQLRAAGTVFDCYVLDVAASMAFQILTQCDLRTSLPTSFLLWHGVRVGSADVTAASALSLAEDLKRMDQVILSQLGKSLGITAGSILYHFNKETLWSGYTLHLLAPKFIRLGTFPRVMARSGTAVRSAPASMFDLMQQTDGRSPYIYVWEQ